MNKEINYNFCFESSKLNFVVNGLEYCMMSGLHELFDMSKSDFAEMILESTEDKNAYQFILTIKKID